MLGNVVKVKVYNPEYPVKEILLPKETFAGDDFEFYRKSNVWLGIEFIKDGAESEVAVSAVYEDNEVVVKCKQKVFERSSHIVFHELRRMLEEELNDD